MCITYTWLHSCGHPPFGGMPRIEICAWKQAFQRLNTEIPEVYPELIRLSQLCMLSSIIRETRQSIECPPCLLASLEKSTAERREENQRRREAEVEEKLK